MKIVDRTVLKDAPENGQTLWELRIAHDFGWALQKLREGEQLTRMNWNLNQRIFLIKGRSISYNTFQSFKNNAFQAFDPPEDVVIRDRIDMKAVDGTYITGWLPSGEDIFAEDWLTVNKK